MSEKGWTYDTQSSAGCAVKKRLSPVLCFLQQWRMQNQPVVQVEVDFVVDLVVVVVAEAAVGDEEGDEVGARLTKKRYGIVYSAILNLHDRDGHLLK